jgi:hypothetical protein
MMIPESYAKDSQEIAGRILDHNDSLGPADLQANLAYPFIHLAILTLFDYFLYILISCGKNITKNPIYKIKPMVSHLLLAITPPQPLALLLYPHKTLIAVFIPYYYFYCV